MTGCVVFLRNLRWQCTRVQLIVAGILRAITVRLQVVAECVELGTSCEYMAVASTFLLRRKDIPHH
jgi:hypothetical protein